jgi:ribokinase
MANPKPILVVGSINMDLVVTAAHIPAPGETILGTNFQTHPGGKGANQAVAAARLAVPSGVPVQMIGQLGSDDTGKQLRASLESAGVNTAAVGTVPGSSGVALITVSAKGENSIVVIPGANSHVTPAYLDRHFNLIQSAGIVLAQLEIPLESILHLATLCAQANVPLMLDPAPAQPLPASLYAQVAWFTPNETEAAFYLGHPVTHPESAAHELLAKGTQGVLLKLGSRGAYFALASGNEAGLEPFHVQAVDSTGAGDAFNGAFAAALTLGAQESMATMAEVQALLGRD